MFGMENTTLVRRRGPRVKYTEDIKTVALSAYLAGRTTKEIMADTGMSYATLQNIVREYREHMERERAARTYSK